MGRLVKQEVKAKLGLDKRVSVNKTEDSLCCKACHMLMAIETNTREAETEQELNDGNPATVPWSNDLIKNVEAN